MSSVNLINDAQLQAINAAFRSFDEDGNNSLSREEVTTILYKISKNQSIEDVDKEVDELMNALDRDKSGQVSYAEFCFGQKHIGELTPFASKALAKLTDVMVLKQADRDKVMAENQDNFTRLLHEKELKEHPELAQQENTEVNDLKNKLAAQEQRIAELEKELEGSKSQVSKLNQDLEAATRQQEVRAAEADKAKEETYTKTISDLESTVSDLHQQLAATKQHDKNKVDKLSEIFNALKEAKEKLEIVDQSSVVSSKSKSSEFESLIPAFISLKESQQKLNDSFLSRKE